jgi:hypothetical protein
MSGNIEASAISHERLQNAERNCPNKARNGQEFTMLMRAAQQARNGCLIGVAD